MVAAAQQWSGKTDGTPWMHRALVRLLAHMPLGFAYFLMCFALPIYMVAHPKATRAIWRYFRLRHGYGPLKSFCHLWANHYDFGCVVLDRFATYAGKPFNVKVVTRNHYKDLAEEGKGFIMISSHVGNHEMAGYAFKAETPLNVLVYAGEAEAMKKGREEILSKNNIKVIPISEDDFSHVFQLKEAVQNGEVVDIHGDRIFGSTKSFSVDVLGAKASLPQGPFMLASALGIPAISVFCMKTSSRKFDVYVHRLDDDASYKGKTSDRAKHLAERYAQTLTETLESYPNQWYNFYEFWDAN